MTGSLSGVRIVVTTREVDFRKAYDGLAAVRDGAMRARLDASAVLMLLRDRCAGQLRMLPAPLGLYPHGRGEGNPPPPPASTQGARGWAFPRTH